MTWPLGDGEMAGLIRRHDWAATPLGAADGWSERVKAIVELVLASPQVASLALGPERRLIYNDAAARLYGARHLDALGRPLGDAFADSYPQVAPLYDRAFAGETVAVAAQPLAVGTGGGGEMFDAWLTPVREVDGAVTGVHMVGFEIGKRVRAERALQDANELLRRTFDSSLQIIQLLKAVRDERGEIVDFEWLLTNKQWNDRWGPRAGRRLLTENPAVVESGVWAKFLEVIETDVPITHEHYYNHEQFDGWFLQTIAKAGDGILLSTLDITDRKRAEIALREGESDQKRMHDALRESQARQAFLLRLSDALRPLSDSVELERTAVEMLGRELRASRVFYATMDPGEQSWSVARDYHDGVPGNAGHYSLSGFQRARLDQWRRGLTTSVADSEAHPGLNADERNAYAVLGVRAAIGVPLVSGGRFVALLVVNQVEPREWTAGEIALTQETAERTWAAIERARAEAALRASEHKFRTLFASIDEGFLISDVIYDAAGRAIDLEYVDANPAAIRLAGRDFRGQRLRQLDPSYEQYWIDIHADVARTGDPVRDVRYAAPHDQWFEFHVVRLGGEGSHRLATVFQDITDRKRMEEALRSSQERHAFLLKLSDALRAAPDDAIVARAVELLTDELQLDLCYVVDVVTDEDRADVLHQLRRNGDMPGVPAVIRLSDYPEAFLRWQERTLVAEDIANDPALTETDRRNVAAMQFGGLIAAPVRRGAGRPIWSIVAVMAGPRSWTAGDIALVEETAERTWAAVERARAEAALRESEARYRALFESMDEAYAVVEVLKDEAGAWEDFRFVAANPAFMVHTTMPYPVGKTATELLGTPNPRWTQLYGQALDTGEPLRVEEAEDTLGVILDLNIFALDRAQNRVAVLFTNVTERKRADMALRESEERQRLMLELVPALLWSASPDGEKIGLNERWLAYTGQSADAAQNFGWLEAIHPEDLPAAQAAFEHAFATGEPLERQQRIRRAGNGYRWHLVRHVPVRDAAGRIIHWFGAAIDVHEIHELQDRQNVLVAELQHRVRNILTVIRSVFGRTVEAGGDIEDIADHFRGRLDALARTQVVVTQSAEGLVDLENLIRDELLSVGFSDGPDVSIEGPEVQLPAKTAETIGLAIHELTTNAIKYGALQGKRGSLRIEWTANIVERGDPRLVITWTEQGMPAIAVKPARYGFGSELIEEALPYRLGAETRLEFRGGGVRCTISMPLPDAGA